ncbi:MAG: hypothetical protein J6U54_17505 [Clostridiales bacterium]|nr:hypothetical protein [Clostridiales bacterium]
MKLFDGNLISVVKGNSAVIGITITDAQTGEPYILTGDAVVIFTVKNKKGEIVIQKTLTSQDYEEDEQTLECNISPADTVTLLTGEYDYDCLLYSESENLAVTFISSNLVVEKAVGLYTDISGGDAG